MTLKEQWKTIKQNWIIAVVLLLVVLVPMFSGSSGSMNLLSKSAGGYGYAMEEMAMARAPTGIMYDESFAPEVTERKITKTASISNEVERGEFKDAETKLKAIIITTDSYLLNENVHKYGTDRKAYFIGNYQIKVDSSKYAAVVSQLKELGEVQSFSENARDITEQHQDLMVELEAEKSRLARFKEMLGEATKTEEKIQLTDRIYDLERRISYLEDSLENVDKKVEYSTVYVTLTEEQSGYANVMLVKFSELVRSLVESFNGLLSLIFMALPWAVVAFVVWIGVKVVRRK